MSETMVDIEWRISDAPVPYAEALAAMEARVAGDPRRPRAASWSGCSSTRRSTPPAPAPGARDLVAARSAFPVYRSRPRRAIHLSRPGPAGGYVMLDLQRRGADVRRYVERPRGMDHPHPGALQRARASAAPAASASGSPRAAARESKIAAIGVRVRHWVTLPRHRAQRRSRPRRITAASSPAASREHGVTSLAEQGIIAAMPEVDAAMKRAFAAVFAERSTAATSR